VDANNRQLHKPETDRIKELAKGDPKKEARLTEAACSLAHCADGVPKDDPLYPILKGLQDAGDKLPEERNLLEQQIGHQGGRSYGKLFQYTVGDNGTDFMDQTKASTRAGGVLQAVAGGFTMGFGGTITTGGAVACPETGVGCLVAAGGVAVMGYGYDITKAGIYTAYTGIPTITYGEQVLQSLGMSERAAGLTYAALGLSPVVVPAIAQTFVKYAPQLDAALINSGAKIGQNVDDLTASLARNATHSTGNVDRVVLGKFEGDFAGYVGEAKLNGGTWYQTDKVVYEKLKAGLSDVESKALAWQVNEAFLKQQLQKGVSKFEFIGEPIINTLANPATTNSFRAYEIRYLAQEAPKWGYKQVGNSWVKN
jgi:hypothetical protein